jgi:solute carrier family 25 carnitine/acylcarnitine transporter 20/29
MVRGCVAGSLAAIIASVVLCPAEIVQVRIQAGTSTDGSLRTMLHLMRVGGVKTLFHGFGATVLREVPGNLAFFGTLEATRDYFERDCVFRCSTSRTLLAGGLGGVAFWLVALPADAIKTQQQASANLPSFATASIYLYRTQGLPGFYHGLLPVLVRAFPSNAALFYGVEKTQEYFHGRRGLTQ